MDVPQPHSKIYLGPNPISHQRQYRYSIERVLKERRSVVDEEVKVYRDNFFIY